MLRETVVRLVEVRSGTRTVRVHPRLTVAPDLDPGAVAAALRGEGSDVTLVVDVDGTEQELTADLVKRLGLPSGVDALLRAADLPATTSSAPPATTPLPEPEPEPEPTVEPAPTPAPALVDVDRSQLTAAQAQLEAAESAAADSQAAFDKAEASYREAEEALAGAEGGGQSGAGADDSALREAEQRLEAARARTADARRRLVEARENAASGVKEPGDQLQRRVADLEDERRGLQVEAQALADATKVTDALAGLRRLAQVKPKVSPEAIALADRWAEAKARLGELPAPPAPPEWLVEPALAALQEAREAVGRAEKGYLPFSVDAAQVDELERAHREVLDAEQKVMRKPSRLARRKLDQAHAAERQALQAIGVSSYGDYLQRVAPVLENPSSEEHLTRARAALADAEAVWEELHGGQASAEYTAVREEMLAVKADAVQLLGTDPGEDQIEEALRTRTETVVDTTWARQALADALDKVGIAADMDDQDDLESVAERWLADLPDTSTRKREIEDRLQDIDQQLAAAQSDLSSKKENEFFGPDSDPADDPLAELQAAIDEAAAAETAAEQALTAARNQTAERADQAGAELQRLHAASDEAKAAVDEARRRLEESQTALEAARRASEEAAEAVAAAAAAAAEAAAQQSRPAPEPEPEPAGAAAPGAEGAVVSIQAELYLLARIASVRSAGLPLVIDDAFAGLAGPARERLHRILDRSADGVQVVYLTSADDVAGWVGGLGDRAALAAS